MNFILQHPREVATLTAEHLWLVGVSMLLATIVGVPLGILLTRRPKWKAVILGSTNVIQTIPSLALFGLLLPLPWLGARADRLAIVALALYALLPSFATPMLESPGSPHRYAKQPSPWVSRPASSCGNWNCRLPSP